MDTHGVEQIVLAFPTTAAWIICGLLTALCVIALKGGQKLLSRLDEQDEQLTRIRDLLASEVGKLREMQHDVDRRVVRLEERVARHGGSDDA